MPGSKATNKDTMPAYLKRGRDGEEEGEEEEEEEEGSDSARTPSSVSSLGGSVQSSPTSAKKRRLGSGNVTLSPAQSLNKRSSR